MGNKPIKIGIRVDEHVYEAGSVMTGRVYLNVASNFQEQIESLHLKLIGEESVVISHEEESNYDNGDAGHHRHHNYSRTTTTRHVERGTASLVHMDVPLSNFSKLSPGQYEYPFEWEIPCDAPTTVHCRKGESYCEIHYRVMAYLKTSRGDTTKYSDSQVIAICASPPPSSINLGLQFDPEVFRINSCCFHQGSIYLGWDVNKTIAQPNSTVEVGIQGGNHSKVNVDTLRATWSERVSWTAHGRTEEVVRKLSEAQVPASVSRAWKSRGRAIDGRALMDEAKTKLQLQLPSDSRDTYDGRLMRVQHTLTVTAVTPGGCFVTSPESSALVYVRRKEPSNAAVATATPVPTAPVLDFNDEYDDYQPTMVEADLLPADWAPQQADVVTLPASAAVVLEDSRSQQPVIPVSAPDESLDRGAGGSGSTALTRLQLTLSQLYQEDPIIILNDLMRDPAIVASIQNLTPAEYVDTIKCANSKQPGVARLLAGIMGQSFTCQHILACLWGLPPGIRLEVLHQVAPLASDIDTNRVRIERELDENDLLHFRAALK